DREQVAMAVEAHGKRRTVAAEAAVALDVAEFRVRGDGGERVAFPLTRGESALRVRRQRRWKGPAGHPEPRLLAIAPPQDLPGEQLLRDRIRHHDELEGERTDDRVDRRVHLALAFGRREGRDVVAQRLRVTVSTERHAEEIDRFPCGAVVVLA